uniref:Tetraspanin n=1 Tax=Panagrolaimus davidi TaxID=227884 RepID=A0A914QM37_9BILA
MGLNIWDIKLNKKIFFGANAIFWLLGWASLAVGIWLYIEQNSYSLLAPSSYSAMSAAGLCISTGLMVIIVAVVGCLGVWKHSSLLSISYFCVVCLLIGIQLITGIMGTFYEDAVRNRVKYALISTINKTNTNTAKNYPINKIAITWDEMQEALHCCGVEGYRDWFHSARWRKNEFVPDSCCDPQYFSDSGDAMTSCGKNAKNQERWFKEGCKEHFTDWLLQHTTIIRFFTIAFLIVEIILLILGIRLYRYMKAKDKERYTVEYRQGRNDPDGNCNLLQ